MSIVQKLFQFVLAAVRDEPGSIPKRGCAVFFRLIQRKLTVLLSLLKKRQENLVRIDPDKERVFE